MNRLWKYLILFVATLMCCLMCCCQTSAGNEAAALEPEPTPIFTESPNHRQWVGRIEDEFVAASRAVEEQIAEEVEVIKTLDRTEPIYEVYKNGWRVNDATAEIQWMIRDICETYQLPEKPIYGLILAESCFVPNLESFDGGCWGLAQINKFWIRGANITHFTDDYRSRDLCDPYDNLLTLAELMCYARDTYGLDLDTHDGIVKYLYWHNTGKDPSRVTRWDYATRALGYADELVTLQSLD